MVAGEQLTRRIHFQRLDAIIGPLDTCFGQESFQLEEVRLPDFVFE